ncbi:MAG: hypothetical protein U9N14_06880 [Pseudomonadota bacterium]|nr:hypothetical protein [Pseudomonadota bacterium]
MTATQEPARALLATLEELASALEDETRALVTYDADAYAKAMERKETLTGLYGRQLEEIKAGGGDLRKSDPALAKGIEAARSRLIALFAGNLAAIESASIASERIVSYIVESVRRTAGHGANYTAEAVASGPGHPLSMSLNRTF